MNNTEGENKLKIRFRLPNGEEFEAEGPKEFIETQRNYFLTLIGAATTTNSGSQSANPQDPFQNKAPLYKGIHFANIPTELYFWQQLLKEENGVLVLRRKTKLAAPELALILLAGARVILQKPVYNALELAKSFKSCGGLQGRLDRLLAEEIQSGRIIADGAKRSRTYRLSEEGFARAFTLAEKLQKSTNF